MGAIPKTLKMSLFNLSIFSLYKFGNKPTTVITIDYNHQLLAKAAVATAVSSLSARQGKLSTKWQPFSQL